MVSFDSHDQLALAHAVFGSIVGLGTMPAAVLIGRYMRSNPKWIDYHIALNALSAALIVLTFGLGMGSVATAHEGTQFNGPDSDLHHKLGLALLLIVLAEAGLGVVARKFPTRTKNAGKLHPARGLHWAGGLVTSGLMYWILWDGVYTEWAGMSTSMTQSPVSVQILFWVIFLAEVGAYGLHLSTELLSAFEDWTKAGMDEQVPLLKDQ